MAKNVIALASGATERRALPHLVSHLRNRGIRSRVPRCWPCGFPDIPISVGAGRAWFARLHRLEDKRMSPFDRKRSVAPVELGARRMIAGYTVLWRWPSNRGCRRPVGSRAPGYEE